MHIQACVRNESYYTQKYLHNLSYKPIYIIYVILIVLYIMIYAGQKPLRPSRMVNVVINSNVVDSKCYMPTGMKCLLLKLPHIYN